MPHVAPAPTTRRKVLVLAYYFPPMGGSGVQRITKFVKYLPDYGWDPTVLTVNPGGYLAFDESLLEEVSARQIPVQRTRSFDPTQLFGTQATIGLPQESRRRWLSSISQTFFLPDNKIGWGPFALRRAKQLMNAEQYDAILSTAPPYTAHLIGAKLSRWSGCPLVTDYRDDWVGNPRHVYPSRLHRAAHLRLEGYVRRTSAAALAINAPIAAALAHRHPDAGPVSVIPQGFDPEDVSLPAADRRPHRFSLLYAGMFYDAQRPDAFLHGVRRFLDREPAAAPDTDLIFVGLLPAYTKGLLSTLGLEDHVEMLGYLPHSAAVAQMNAATVLWLTIGQRPGAETISTGKLFEYIGTQKPILGLVPSGTARDVLEAYGAAKVADPDDFTAIAEAMGTLYAAWRAGALPQPNTDVVRRYDRTVLAGQLADVLNRVSENA